MIKEAREKKSVLFQPGAPWWPLRDYETVVTSGLGRCLSTETSRGGRRRLRAGTACDSECGSLLKLNSQFLEGRPALLQQSENSLTGNLILSGASAAADFRTFLGHVLGCGWKAGLS